MQNAEFFTEAGGEELQYIPCLNARDDHVGVLASLVERHSGGWTNAPADPASLERAKAMGAER